VVRRRTIATVFASLSLVRWRRAAWLVLPLLLYVIPVFLGFAWSAVGESFNVLNPPDGYVGRLPDSRITVEPWGASTVALPFRVRLREYLMRAELPLWNPYQGLGQPFAAQGEGSPYFPIALARALLPYRLENYVAFSVYLLSAVFCYRFLRGLGLSDTAALFGGVSYPLSGALSLHIARPNIADQLCMVPVLFWAAARAVRNRNVWGYLLLAVVSALHLVAGFIQIAMLAGVLVVCFCLVYARLLTTDTHAWLRETGLVIGSFALGNAMGAISVLPQAEAMQNMFSKNPELLSFIPMPYANVITFFFPTLLGPFFGSWIPGTYPDVTDWNNLFAYAGSGVLLLVIMGWSLTSSSTSALRPLYLFFAAAGAVLTLRYLSFPMVAGLNVLPILGRQSPKHANGIMVFCFVVAAAIAVDFIRARPEVRVRWYLGAVFLGVGSSVLTLIGQRGGLGVIDSRTAAIYVTVTAAIHVILLLALAMARRWHGLSGQQAAMMVGIVILGELATYIPLGNGGPLFVVARLAIFAMVAAVGFAVATSRALLASVGLSLVLGAYVIVVAVPSRGLPHQFALDQPPRFMAWLHSAAGVGARSFGVWPEGSSIASVQDIGAVGPLAPTAFRDFVEVVAAESQARFYRSSTIFMLGGFGAEFTMAQYHQARPVLDWVGVRYLVLDRRLFRSGAREDHLALIAEGGLNVAYEDDRAIVLESASAGAKAVFVPSVEVLPDRAAVLQVLKENPRSIDGPPKIEAGSMADAVPGNMMTRRGQSESSVTIETYDPSFVRLVVDAPSPGLVVLKDAYAPGWAARVDSRPATLLRVNGFVRGAFVATSGRHIVELSYRPRTFVAGLWLTSSVGALLLVTAAYSWLRRSSGVPVGIIAAGAAFIVAFIALAAYAYFGQGGSLG
jgi:hypothetical protein